MISTEENFFKSKLVVDSFFFDEAKYDFAFYLIKVGEKEKIDARWYQNNMSAVFDVTNMYGTFYIRCFIRDKEINNKRTFDSEKITINV